MNLLKVEGSWCNDHRQGDELLETILANRCALGISILSNMLIGPSLRIGPISVPELPPLRILEPTSSGWTMRGFAALMLQSS